MRLILLILLISNLLSAQKVALVIGNSDYNTGRLPNPTKDADLIAQSLEAVGFEVTIQKDLTTLSQMKKAINNFAKTLQKDDIAVVYYAGHGVQCKGKNYLMPTKADVVRGAQLASEALDLDFLIGGVSEIKLTIVMLDACRNNTYPSCSKSQTRGLVQPTVADEGGMILSFATAPNDIAQDGDGDHSPYAMALSKYMTQSMPIETYFRRVGGEVYNSTGSQRPMLKNSFYGEFSFVNIGVNPNVTIIGDLIWEGGINHKAVTKPWITEANADAKNYMDTSGDTATSYCDNLSWGGYSDWRLPTKDELRGVVNECGGINNIYGDKDWNAITDKNINNKTYQSCYKSKGFNGDGYWSSTNYERYISGAWFIALWTCSTFIEGKVFSRYVRCVRVKQ